MPQTSPMKWSILFSSIFSTLMLTKSKMSLQNKKSKIKSNTFHKNLKWTW